GGRARASSRGGRQPKPGVSGGRIGGVHLDARPVTTTRGGRGNGLVREAAARRDTTTIDSLPAELALRVVDAGGVMQAEDRRLQRVVDCLANVRRRQPRDTHGACARLRAAAALSTPSGLAWTFATFACASRASDCSAAGSSPTSPAIAAAFGRPAACSWRPRFVATSDAIPRIAGHLPGPEASACEPSIDCTVLVMSPPAAASHPSTDDGPIGTLTFMVFTFRSG